MILQRTRDAYERYLTLIDQYDLFAAGDKKLYQQYTRDPAAFSTISTTNSEARRATKIANFKQEKELKRKLEVTSRHLSPRRVVSSHLKPSANWPPQHLSQNPDALRNDDDALRDLHTTNIHLSTHTTFQTLESLALEFQILALAPPTPAPGPEALERDYRERNGLRDTPDYSDRLDMPSQFSSSNTGPILDPAGKPLRPFTMLDSRQTLQKGVFKSGHRLPTMTIDEYLEEEKRRGGIIEGGGEASGRAPVPDEDNYEKADAEIMKAREWDEYVEANPK